MPVFRCLVKLVKLLNSETSSLALALALSLGMFLGLVPILSLQGLLAAGIVLFFRVNIAAAFLAFCIFKLAALGLGGLLDALGVAVIEAPALTGLWAWLYNAPVLSLLGTNHSVTLGGTIVAAALFAPVFLGARALIESYRAWFNERWTQLAVVNAFRATKLYRAYLWLDSPFHR